MKTPTSRPQTLARVSTLAAVATAATGAHAAIVNFSTTITSDGGTYGATGWNIDGTGGVEANLVNFQTGKSNFFPKNLAATGASFRVVVNAGKLKGLSASAPINASQAFAANVSSVFVGSIEGAPGDFRNAVNFVSGSPTYIGFQFKPGSTVLYGWANVTLTTGGYYGTFTINNWAYDDTGASILTGQTVATPVPVPEPASYAVGLGALALGAAALRRRRQARAVAA